MYNPRLHFHFTGIGGAGMSSIAEVLLAKGFAVSGTDLADSATVERLRSLGATVAIGHATEHLSEAASLVVYSSAVPQSNPEIVEARRRGIPVVPRAEVLAELMRLTFGIAVGGSHGKTTTTSMVSKILEVAGLDPTTIIGGTLRHELSGGKVGKGKYLVAEADESDRSFLLLRPTIAIVTNVDDEHLESYRSSEELDGAFLAFIDSVPFYGLTICCADNPRLESIRRRSHRRICTYGFAAEADIRAANLRHDHGVMRYELLIAGVSKGEVTLRMPGSHLVQNSLAAVAVGLELGVSIEIITEALSQFPGVTRRLEVLGEPSGITVMNDYGHHPTEVVATLTAIKEGWGKSIQTLHVVFEPHRYSRTQQCLDLFTDSFQLADKLYLAPIYAAGEKPLPGVTSELLYQRINHPSKVLYSTFDEIFEQLCREAYQGDLVLFLGAGPVGKAAYQFLQLLESGVYGYSRSRA
jgi:UDP-N-acetylmuramate--alanine ligase